MQLTEHNDGLLTDSPYRAEFLNAYKVLFNRQVESSACGGGGLFKEISTSEGEKIHQKFEKKPIKIIGPLEVCNIIEVEAETEAGAAAAAVHILGAYESEGELVTITNANFKKASGR